MVTPLTMSVIAAVARVPVHVPAFARNPVNPSVAMASTTSRRIVSPVVMMAVPPVPVLAVDVAVVVATATVVAVMMVVMVVVPTMMIVM